MAIDHTPDESAKRTRAAGLVPILRSREFWLLGLAALLTLTIAFQAPYTYQLDFGASNDRFLIEQGLYDPEENAEPTARWTGEHAVLVLPALSGGEWTLNLALNGWQPEGAPVVELRAGDQAFEHQATGDWETWEQTIIAAPGDLRVELDADTFRPSDSGNTDTRDLGVRLDTLTVAPEGAGLRIPPLFETVLPMTLAVLFCFVSLRLLQIRIDVAVAASGLVLLGFALLVAFGRSFANAGLMQNVVLVAGLSLLLILFGLDALGGWFRRTGVALAPRELNWLGLIVVGTVAVKWIGVFFPNVYIIDALFHLHRLEFVQEGTLFFVTRSREFASLETVYPPGLYVFLLPLSVLAPNDLNLLKFALPLMEATGGVLLYWVARKNGLSATAALCALLVYLTVPIAFITFGWGVYSNLFAQLLLVLGLALWSGLEWDSRPLRSIPLMTFAFTLGFLSHASMLALLIVFWGLVIGGTLLFRASDRKRALYTAAALGLALLVVFVLYFSFFLDKTLNNLAALQARPTETSPGFERAVGGGVDASDLGLVPIQVHSWLEWATEGAGYLVRETWVYYRGVVVVLALGGVYLLWRTPNLQTVAVIASAGLVTVLLFFLVGLGINLYTRYMLFGAPFIALGAGYVLARLWQGQGLQRAAVLATFALIVVSSSVFWISRVAS